MKQWEEKEGDRNTEFTWQYFVLNLCYYGICADVMVALKELNMGVGLS